MPVDRYGYTLTTTSDAAARAWTDGADRFLAADEGALDAFDRAIAVDDEFALAHAGRARILALRGLMPDARSEAARAVELAADATPREQSHADVIATLAQGDSAGALNRIRRHVEQYPRDAFALQPATNVFGLIGLSGRIGREQEAFDLLAPLAGEYGDDWWYQGALGFWHTELGRIEQGLAHNRRSFDANPRNGNAVHGLAHAWYELGDDVSAIDFLTRFLARYPREGGMHCHLSWHLALIALRSGDSSRAWTVYRDAVDPRSRAPAPPLNMATDSVSLLWQALLHGEPVSPDHWEAARDYIGERFPAAASGFLEVHRALALLMAGDRAAAASIVAAMREAEASGTFAWGAVAPDAIEALALFAAGDDRAAIALLAPRQDEFVRIGGSHAQRDLFKHTLVAACLRDGRPDDARQAAASTPWRVDRGAQLLVERAARDTELRR